MKVHHIIATKPFYCTYTSQIYTYCMRLVEQREVVVVGIILVIPMHTPATIIMVGKKCWVAGGGLEVVVVYFTS